ncbi:hypothetical protein BC940DRAFT_319681 [Gongronella butleri]|nr:hypothetical protein BC940DRAFT_319681 [Gongronella butleri]
MDSQEFGEVYDCHYVDPANPLPSGAPSGHICGFHVHGHAWRLALQNGGTIADNELRACPFFNFTYCILYHRTNLLPKSCPPVPECFCSRRVALKETNVGGGQIRLKFVCPNFYIDHAKPKCSWFLWADELAFTKPKHRRHDPQFFKDTIERIHDRQKTLMATHQIDQARALNHSTHHVLNQLAHARGHHPTLPPMLRADSPSSTPPTSHQVPSFWQWNNYDHCENERMIEEQAAENKNNSSNSRSINNNNQYGDDNVDDDDDDELPPLPDYQYDVQTYTSTHPYGRASSFSSNASSTASSSTTPVAPVAPVALVAACTTSSMLHKPDHLKQPSNQLALLQSLQQGKSTNLLAAPAITNTLHTQSDGDNDQLHKLLPTLSATTMRRESHTSEKSDDELKSSTSSSTEGTSTRKTTTTAATSPSASLSTMDDPLHTELQQEKAKNLQLVEQIRHLQHTMQELEQRVQDRDSTVSDLGATIHRLRLIDKAHLATIDKERSARFYSQEALSNVELELQDIAAEFALYDLESVPATRTTDLKCQVCYSSAVNCAMIPCFHAVYCLSCASKLKECAVCRTSKKTLQKIFL